MNKDLIEAINMLNKGYISYSKYKKLLTFLEDLVDRGDENSFPFSPTKLIDELQLRYGELNKSKDFYPAPPLPLNEYPEIHKIINWKSEE